ncbi:EAL domain-containing protein [Vibrio ostreicida]|uniref:EAL domain-containing protein n=1 Tax=Vibrio ostreicida TaxID=526588 RepID=A0ABT8BTG0_9VIBR|nr:EAL domain-containing protein [Vibrio ostreicida]MDN3610276.1 EAL domain-containing protein [Vibrio ostreicida]NPD07709.1 EAL domain-containing protein [Vibrio ostreicida]
MNRVKSIQTQILLSFLAVLIAVQSILFYSFFQSNAEERQELAQIQINTARVVFENQFNQQTQRLTVFAQTVAKDFGLKQALREDTRSFLVALNNHRQRIAADLAIAVNKNGEFIGKLVFDKHTNRTIANTEVTTFTLDTSRLPDPDRPILYEFMGEVFQLVLVPVQSGAESVAWIGFGFAIDEALADRLALLTGMNVDIGHFKENRWRILASSLDPEQRLTEGAPSDSANLITTEVEFGFKQNKKLIASLYLSRDDLFAALQKRWIHVILIVVITFGFSVLAAFLLSKSIAKPLQTLVKKAQQIARGEDSGELIVNRRDELGVLALEFNLMNQAVRERQDQLNYLAFHSDLTRMPNKKKLVEDISSLIRQHCQGFLLIRFRLLEFEELNYSLGLDTGEELQVATASRLLALEQQAQFYQFDSSEFALLTQCHPEETDEETINVVLRALAGTFELQRLSVTVHTASGYCRYPKHGETARQLLHNAGIALQQAMKWRLSNVEFAANMAESAINRVRLTHELTEAIEQDQLVLHFQPKLNLANNKVDRVEALVRWNHPQLGMVPPDEFIDIAETTGQIDALTDWVIDHSLHHLHQWKMLGYDLGVAINISAVNLKQSNFATKVRAFLTHYQCQDRDVTLELTESALAEDPDNALMILRQLSEQGLSISIDDYGTGYSSLSQLKQLPANELKIDKSFVLNVANDRQDQIIARSTIQLAQHFGLKTVAEGVENQASLDWLKQRKCDYAQGFYISRPLSAQALMDWLQQLNQQIWTDDKTNENAIQQSG